MKGRTVVQKSSRKAASALIAGQTARRLEMIAVRKGEVAVLIGEGKQGVRMTVPAHAIPRLYSTLQEMSGSNLKRLVAPDAGPAEISTAKAARLLGVSRPHLITMLESNRLPYRMVGTHRRLRLDDVLALKREDEKAREKILDKLARKAQASRMGY